MQPSSAPGAPGASTSAAPDTGGAVFFKVEKRDLLRYLGNRIRVGLDDNTTLTGRLVSVSASGNVVLTDVERERSRKRRRGESREAAAATADGSSSKVSRECYASVIFLRGSCIATITHTSGVTTDKAAVSVITGSREEHASRTIEVANANPAVRF